MFTSGFVVDRSFGFLAVHPALWGDHAMLGKNELPDLDPTLKEIGDGKLSFAGGRRSGTGFIQTTTRCGTVDAMGDYCPGTGFGGLSCEGIMRQRNFELFIG